MRYLALIPLLLTLALPVQAAETALVFGASQGWDKHEFDGKNTARTVSSLHHSQHAQTNALSLRVARKTKRLTVEAEGHIAAPVTLDGKTAPTAWGRRLGYKAKLRTQRLGANVWLPVATTGRAVYAIGAGAGLRHTAGDITGPGLDRSIDDTAPYALLGARITRPLTARKSALIEARYVTSPPIHTGADGSGSNIDHEVAGFELILGLALTLD
ncbi:hypothetical protein [Cognatishimia sp. MH4019]|uniref:hypothetical protein n=1 Tax=Cognatishimia sp. MH4019 TaxID=2854030 RepID=UPI001CD691B1|nr:hypothetical protein [Cognatishimia sp. MH4019]